MKYKLINTKTNEETPCDKVTIDGFDYYVSDEKINVGDYYLTFTNKTVMGDVRKCEDSSYNFTHCKKVIATNNPNIDIPKVVDEVEIMALLQYPYPLDVKDKNDKIIQTKGEKPFNHAKIEKYRKAFAIGYNKSQETHPFSEEDMIEFAEWKGKEKFEWNIRYNNWTSQLVEYSGCVYTTQELLQIWKEQQPKIVYYE